MTRINSQKLTMVTALSILLLVSGCSLKSKNNSAVEERSSNLNSMNNTRNSDQNKRIVRDFYEGVFLRHQVEEFSDLYLGERYTQHNPLVEDGKQPFVEFFTQYFKANPQAKNVIKRVIAEGDLVMLHVHSTKNDRDRGSAVIDIFRVENGKIVEHWDVQQDIPERTRNNNGVF